MEDIRRNIKLFFTAYGSLFLQLIGIIAIVFFVLQSLNNVYKDKNVSDSSQNILIEQKKIIEEEKENIEVISKFLDYCNEKNVEKAYSMLSEECIKEKYQTIDIFKTEYMDKIFTYKKEYEIKKENEKYKITILDGILESGTVENRKYVISYYKIDESILEKYIFIER